MTSLDAMTDAMTDSAMDSAMDSTVDMMTDLDGSVELPRSPLRSVFAPRLRVVPRARGALPTTQSVWRVASNQVPFSNFQVGMSSCGRG